MRRGRRRRWWWDGRRWPGRVPDLACVEVVLKLLRTYLATVMRTGRVRSSIQVYSHKGPCTPHPGYPNLHRSVLAGIVGYTGVASRRLRRSQFSDLISSLTPSPWSPVDSCSML